MVEPFEIVADAAAETHKDIKEINRQYAGKINQTKKLARDGQISALKDKWWEENKGYF